MRIGHVAFIVEKGSNPPKVNVQNFFPVFVGDLYWRGWLMVLVIDVGIGYCCLQVKLHVDHGV